MKRLAVGVVLAAGIVFGTGAAAMAGEYTGNGGDVRGGDNARSACHFSGRDLPDSEEDNPPGFDDDEVTDGHVQSYGQIVRAGGKAFAPSPGEACRGNAAFEE